MVGQTVTHYRILDRLGGGGMGVVYRAEDLRLGRGVAIKFLPEGVAQDEQTLERFQREARAASALNHPHICTIYEIDEWEGQPFIVMELMEGSTLKHRIGGRPLPIAEVVDLSLQIVEGLEAAHEAGIVHRDIKPANLFVTRRGQAKILDFGLAKHAPPPSTAPANAELAPTQLPQEAALTGSHVTVGTAAYMSPEQARGELVDARSDLFSLGVVMFELATGRTPFPGESSAEIFVRILEHPAPLPSQLNPHVPPELDRIILAALEKDRKLRTQNAEELGAELARLRRDVTSQKVATPPVQVAAPAAPVAAPPAHVAAAPAPAAAGRRWRLLAAGGAAALALAAAVWLGRQAKQPRAGGRAAVAQASVAVLPFVDMSPGKDQEYFSDGLTEELLNALAQIPELRVAARTSAFAFKGKEVSATEIGRQLNVSTLLEGSVRKAEDQVRITAQLIKVDDGFHLWSESYDRQLDDIFAVQEDIARAVAGALQVTLLPGDGAAGPSPEGVAPEAYTAYLEGRYFADRLGEEDLRRAVERFERAIALAPSYAPAWAGLATAVATQGVGGTCRSRRLSRRLAGRRSGRWPWMNPWPTLMRRWPGSERGTTGTSGVRSRRSSARSPWRRRMPESSSRPLDSRRSGVASPRPSSSTAGPRPSTPSTRPPTSGSDSTPTTPAARKRPPPRWARPWSSIPSGQARIGCSDSFTCSRRGPRRRCASSRLRAIPYFAARDWPWRISPSAAAPRPTRRSPTCSSRTTKREPSRSPRSTRFAASATRPSRGSTGLTPSAIRGSRK